METRHDQMKDQVEAFHEKHPEVWDLFVKFTFDRIKRGFKNYSVNGILSASGGMWVMWVVMV